MSRGRIPQCCKNRLGLVKALHPTESKANKVAAELEAKYGVRFVSYACMSGNGWHVKKKRSRRR